MTGGWSCSLAQREGIGTAVRIEVGDTVEVLVTGAFGNLGTHTIEVLLNRGHRVRCLDLETRSNRKTARRFRDRVETVWGDVRRADDVVAALRGVEAVVHLAFVTDLLWSERHPDLAREVNVGGTTNLLYAMKDSSRQRRIVFASSASVFGETQHLPPPRTVLDPPRPALIYARHKVECEELIRESGLDWCILRLALAPAVARTGFDPVVFDWDLGSRMEFLHPRDAGLALAKCIDSVEAWGKVLLVGGGPGCQMYFRDFFRRTAELIGGLPDEAFARPGSPAPSDWLDTKESQRMLDYQRLSLEDYMRDRRASLGPARYLAPLVAPLIRRRLLRQSPYYKANKQLR